MTVKFPLKFACLSIVLHTRNENTVKITDKVQGNTSGLNNGINSQITKINALSIKSNLNMTIGCFLILPIIL